MVRRIVTSSAYRQSSKVTPDGLAKDPGPSASSPRRPEAPPAGRVHPRWASSPSAAPAPLDDRIGGRERLPLSAGGALGGIVVVARGRQELVKAQTPTPEPRTRPLQAHHVHLLEIRTSPPPTLVTFDAPDRETCTVRRARTNTPLQALVLLNDPTYVEASRKLAERLIREAGSVDDRLTLAFRLVLARRPTAGEMDVLRQVHRDALARFRADGEAARKLLSVGESPRDPKLDAAELAAWSTVAGVVLNLDEAVTRG